MFWYILDTFVDNEILDVDVIHGFVDLLSALISFINVVAFICWRGGVYFVENCLQILADNWIQVVVFEYRAGIFWLLLSRSRSNIVRPVVNDCLSELINQVRSLKTSNTYFLLEF